MRRLGVDPGSVRVGLSFMDEGAPLVVPIGTVEVVKKDVAAATREVAEVAKRRGAEEVVVGLPLSLAGREGIAARRARRFADSLQAQLGVPVVLWDERLTTAQAERGLRELGVGGRARREVVDQAAATLLLQSYVDAKAG
ncbi:MAG: Holliday junction resolvase RuvX [Deltaproteobacteria bacterium]|nr:Holliday junction resolvase RuvX [Deltaproteobacteria bacterium]